MNYNDISDNIEFVDNGIYCGKCEYLNYTEKEQQTAFGDPEHRCLKYNKELKHKGHHPQIVKCEECRNK